MISLIKSIQKECRGIKNIGNGGCAVFAALVARQLHILGEEFEIKTSAQWGDNETNCNVANESFAAGNNAWDSVYGHGICCHHVFIACNGFWFDHDDITAAEDKLVPSFHDADAFPGSLSPELTLAIAANGYWNPIFKRSDIPRLDKAIKKGVKKFLTAR